MSREDAEGHVDAHAHVGREQDRRVLRPRPAISSRCAGVKPGGADHRARRRAARPGAGAPGSPPAPRTRSRMRSWPSARLRVGGDRDAEPADARDLPRVARRARGARAPRGRPPGAGPCPLARQRDETVAHPAGGAGDDDVRHDGRSDQPLTRPSGSSDRRGAARRLASPIRHIGSRNSGSSMPIMRHRFLDRDRIGLEEHGPRQREELEVQLAGALPVARRARRASSRRSRAARCWR